MILNVHMINRSKCLEGCETENGWGDGVKPNNPI